MLKEIEQFHDTPKEAMNKLMNAVQHLRCDCAVMYQSGKDYHITKDDVKMAQALAREIEELYNKYKK